MSERSPNTPDDTIYTRPDLNLPKEPVHSSTKKIINGSQIRTEILEALSQQDNQEASTLGGTEPSTEPEIG